MSTNLQDMKQGEKAVTPTEKFSGFLDKYKAQIKQVLPAHLNADRMARLMVSEFARSRLLQEAEPATLLSALMTASTLGLEIGVQGQAFLVPYKDTRQNKVIAQLIPGWKGLVDIVNRSGRATVWTGVIMSDQRYTFTDGSKRDLVIHNETSLDDPSEITHAYAIGWVRDAVFPVIELWTVAKIKHHRDRFNKQGDKHYSFRNWEMYARKIPLLQVLKYMPQSIELANALTLETAAEMGAHATINGSFVDVTGLDEPPADDAPPPEAPAAREQRRPPQGKPQTPPADEDPGLGLE